MLNSGQKKQEMKLFMFQYSTERVNTEKQILLDLIHGDSPGSAMTDVHFNYLQIQMYAHWGNLG